MPTPTIAVLQFPGSNCERESAMAIERAKMKATFVLWTSSEDLNQFDGFVIVGGFSYEDRGRSGLIAAKDPMMLAIKEQAALGKPILGICNGAQILVESGLVPGAQNNQLGMALTLNKRVKDGEVQGTGFYNDWRHVKPLAASKAEIFDRWCDAPINIPLAHGEGRFVMPDSIFEMLQSHGASLWQYCDQEGSVSDEFPVNPNGSMHSLAAVSNISGNVLAMMPHPERCEAGDVIFTAMRDYILSAEKPGAIDVVNLPELSDGPTYDLNTPMDLPGFQLIVKNMITDNTCVSVNKAVKKMGLNVELARYDFWAVDADESVKEQVCESYELFNPSKQMLVDKLVDNSQCFLATPDFDALGKHKCHNLKKLCGIDVKSVNHGVIWQVSGGSDQDIQTLLDEHVFANPFGERLFAYK